MKQDINIIWVGIILLSINITGCVEESEPSPTHIDESWLTISDEEFDIGITSISWSTDGNFLATTTFYANLIVFNTTNWQNAINLTGEDNPVGMISWSADGDKLASYCFDGSVRIWNTSTWVVDRVLIENDTAFYPYAWNFKGTMLASYIWGLREIRIWDTNTWEIVGIINDMDEVDYISWSPDGNEIAFAIERAVYIYDTMNWNFKRKIRQKTHV